MSVQTLTYVSFFFRSEPRDSKRLVWRGVPPAYGAEEQPRTLSEARDSGIAPRYHTLTYQNLPVCRCGIRKRNMEAVAVLQEIGSGGLR